MQKTFKRYIEAKTEKQAREKFWKERGSSVPPAAPWFGMTVFEFQVTMNYPFEKVARKIQD